MEDKLEEEDRFVLDCILISNYVISKGFTFDNELDLINIIENNNIDISHFELPYHCKNLNEWREIINNI